MTRSAISPLDKINKSNVKGLKLAYAVALGGTAGNENLQATPLVEDGFMYIVDGWGMVYKIDVRSGDAGRIVWRMDPKQEKLGPQPRRRAVGQSGDLGRRLRRPRHRHQQGHRQGRLGQEPRRPGRPGAHRRAAGGQGQDHGRRRRRRPRRARLDRRARRQDRQARVEIRGAGAGRARQRDLEGQEQRLADRRRRHLGDRHLRSGQQPDHLGHRQSGADVRSGATGRATISTPTA